MSPFPMNSKEHQRFDNVEQVPILLLCSKTKAAATMLIVIIRPLSMLAPLTDFLVRIIREVPYGVYTFRMPMAGSLFEWCRLDNESIKEEFNCKELIMDKLFVSLLEMGMRKCVL